MKTIALLGNPNTGKTSLFNTLTNSYEYVGNWSGVTVEKKIGTLLDKSGKIVDLPGIYDLAPLSKEEGVVTTFLLENNYEIILNILDASLLERNLHLTVQLLELGKPLHIALNMIDVANKRHLSINLSKLSIHLHSKVVPVIARKGEGKENLVSLLNSDRVSPNFNLYYGKEIESVLNEMTTLLQDEYGTQSRWLALQFLSGNDTIKKHLATSPSCTYFHSLYRQLENNLEGSVEEHLYFVRQQFIDKVVRDCVSTPDKPVTTWSTRLDELFTNPILGLPIFFALMYLVFQMTFKWIGAPISDLLDGFLTGPLTTFAHWSLTSMGASNLLQDLILDGILTGIGGVLVFVPQVLVLFFFISLLEDSGYMARIATVMDRIMEFFGLNGKAFIPMIISFGCNVPGIMAARTVEQEKDRLLTILVAPFMSCSARLPVYALFAGAFFAANQTIVIFSLYILGIIMALLVTKILSITLLKNTQSLFIIELPPYRIPHLKSLWRNTWEKGKGFIRKAGTVIFAGSIIIWLLTYAGPNGFDVSMNESFLAKIGSLLAPLFAPLGFGTWEASASLLTGFLAKEVIVSSMSIIYGVGDNLLGSTLSQTFSPLSAYAFLVFILLYVPCLATVAVIRRETGSLKWTAFSIVYPLVIAYTLTFIIYQIGSLFM